MTRTTEQGRHHRASRTRWSRRARVLSAIVGCLLTATIAFAATNWVVGMTGTSGGAAQAGTVSNLTITATTSPAPANVLFPGGVGDVVATIANPNAFPVTITGFYLPSNTTYATGYTDSTLTTPTSGCGASSSGSAVTFSYAAASSGTSHTLSSALVVGASASLVVKLTNDATMGTTSAAACQAQYFVMPAFVGVSATAGGGAATTSPATVAWTS